MNKYLYRAKIAELRLACTDPSKAVTHVPRRCTTTTTNAGYYRLKLKGSEKFLTMVIQKSDLYVQGFISSHGNFKFDDAAWDIAASTMGFGGSYRDLDWDRTGIHSPFDCSDINTAIDCLVNASDKTKWKANITHVRRLVIAFAEGARMYNIQESVENKVPIDNVDWHSRGGNVLALVKG